MSTPLTEDQVRHVAKLSRLTLSDDQVHEYTTQLARIVEYIDKLGELNVDDVEPMAHPTAMTNKLRDDEPTEPLPVEKVLHNAPDADPPYFKVPKVLGDGSSA